MANTVTRIDLDALLEWSVGTAEHSSFGHVYGREITPVGTDEVEVTNYCDWTNVPAAIVPIAMMERSVAKLAALAAGDAGAAG